MFDVLAEPTRRRILDRLLDHDHPVGELVEHLGLSQPAVSKHLRVLRDAGLVTVVPRAQQRIYRLHAEAMREVIDWLEPYRLLWKQRLDDLERHLDSLADAP